MSHECSISEVVHGISRNWVGAPNISVVASSAALPFHAPFPVLGALSGDDVFVVADAQSPDKAQSTLMHEVVGHHGFRSMLGSHWHRYMTHVLGAMRAGEPSLQLAREVVREIYVDGRGVCNLTPIEEADETIARLVEWSFNGATGDLDIENPLRKQAKALAAQSARELLHIDIPLTRDQVEGAIMASEHTVRHGAPFFGLCGWLPGWYPSRMHKPMGPSRPASDWNESKQLLAEADHADGRWGRIKETLGFLLIVGAVLGMIWWFFAMFGLIFFR